VLLCLQAFDSCYDATKERGAEEQECMPLVRTLQPVQHSVAAACDAATAGLPAFCTC
jgi:hypothetical protein